MASNGVFNNLYSKINKNYGCIKFQRYAKKIKYAKKIRNPSHDTIYNNFNNNRDIYPDFESFIPEYIQFMKGIAGQIEEIIAEYENKVPRVVSVFPPNGSTVSSQIKEARIVFNVPMRNAHGVRPLDEDSENRKPFLQPMGVSLSPNKRTIIIPINLEANTKYGCILNTFFRSEEGYDATKEYEWKFDTK
jgi:hypothetical protein